MRAPLVVVLALTFGCAGTAGGAGNEARGRPLPSGNDEVMRDDTPAQHGTLISVTLDAEPAVHLGEEEELGLRVRVTNEGDDPIDPETLAAQLRVDDLPARELSLDGRGFGPLAPGQTLEWRERTRAVRLFDEPGDHTLRLEIGGVASEPIHVQVSE